MGKVLIGNIKGPQGPTGVRGGMWLQGTAVTGTSTEETSFPDSNITYAIIGDAYFNVETCNVYACTKAGNPTDAKWVYTGNIKGVKGDTGSTQSIQNAVLEFNEALTRENIESTDTVETIFGKVKKYFTDLGSAAFMKVVNNVTQSEAGQAVLDAAVGKYLEEKKFDISKIIANRNITEPGFVMDGKTVADALTELNGNIATQTRNGMMSAADKKKLDGISAGANAYSLPLATSGVRGGVKIGYAANGKNYPVQMSNEQMYVNVPWTDTNTWREIQDNLTSTATNQSLSAAQGRALANGSARGSTKLPLAGGSITGNLSVGTYTFTSNEIRSSSGIHLIPNNGLTDVYLRGRATYALKEDGTTWTSFYGKAFTVKSTRKAKENFHEISDEEAEALLLLDPMHFDYINGEKDQSGFIAEDVEPIYPEICSYVSKDNNGEVELFGIDYSKFTPYIIKLLQVQQKRIKELSVFLEKQEKEIENLKIR